MSIDDVIDQKVNAMDSHVSQFYEWLPWVAGTLDQVPADPAERKVWLKRTWFNPPNADVRAALVKWYGPEVGNRTKYYEAFEICEYGSHPDEARLRELFPMLH